MIYQFPTNRNIDSAFKGETGSTMESYIDSNLPAGKVGKLIDLAIELVSGTSIRPFINTKVPVGKRDKLIEICFVKQGSFFICALASKSRAAGQLLEFAEVVDYVNVNRPLPISVVPVLIVQGNDDFIHVVEATKVFKNTRLHTIKRSDLCDTLNSWQN
jgi:hypothetical protein